LGRPVTMPTIATLRHPTEMSASSNARAFNIASREAH
jgi:hypothetical protein